jgi:uncharacterized protein YjdB
MGQGYPKWFSMPLLFLAVLVTASCSVDTGLDSFDGFTGPSTACVNCNDVVAVRITPAQSTILVGGTLQLLGEPIDDSSAIVNGPVIFWTTTDEDVAKVTSSGMVTALAVGSVTITGSTGEISGIASVTVSTAP